MPIPLIGFQSEYVINHLSCEFETTTEYNVLRTPAAPDYYYGNLLALSVPLHTHSRRQWQQKFQAAFRHNKGIQHETYLWQRREDDGDAERIAEFMDENFSYEEIHILTQARTHFRAPARLATHVDIRPLRSAADWQQWCNSGLKEQGDQHEQTSLRRFLQGRIDNYQKLEQNNYGQYLGAFDGERLIGYAGLYHLGGLARFQNVFVDEEYRRQAIAQTLLTALIQQTHSSVETLCIHADENYHATELYQRLGFGIAARECSLCWWPGKPQFN